MYGAIGSSIKIDDAKTCVELWLIIIIQRGEKYDSLGLNTQTNEVIPLATVVS